MKTQKRGGVEEEELIHFVDGTAFVGVVYGYITAFIDFLELLSINPLWNHWSYLQAFLVRADTSEPAHYHQGRHGIRAGWRKTKHSRISVWQKNTQNQVILTL